MPEYLAPGVYVEETSFRSKSIEGVSTSTAGFIGPTRFGPARGVPELLTSFADFERIYGGIDPLIYGDASATADQANWMAHAVRNYFEEGGQRLYVTRVYNPALDGDDKEIAGIASGSVGTEDNAFTVSARYPGRAGNVTVSFTLQLGQDVLGRVPVDPSGVVKTMRPVLRGVSAHDTVFVAKKEGADPTKTESFPADSDKFDDGQLYTLIPTVVDGKATFLLQPWGTDAALALTDLDPDAIAEGGPSDPSSEYSVRVVTCTVTMSGMGRFMAGQTWTGCALDPHHPQSLAKLFATNPQTRSTALFVPLTMDVNTLNGAGMGYCILAMPRATGAHYDDPTEFDPVLPMLLKEKSTDLDRSCRITLSGGLDGLRPTSANYEGDDGSTASGLKSGFVTMQDVDDISIVAAPGASYNYSDSDWQKEALQINLMLISHAEQMRYRIAVLDAGNGLLPSEVRAMRAQFDSTHAAFYYPWVTVMDPVTRRPINLPPSGFVTGIYGRTDVQYGVHKAPANEVVRSAIGFELTLNKAQQDVLNPEGINCFRFFEGRGYRLWGARLASSDPEWKYVNVRRYFNYLEHSVDKGTQWVVFMNNSDLLWSNVRRTLEDFLFNEWKNGRLMGQKPEEGYFVKCDRSTMTQNDLDNGRLIVLVGVSPVKPAEFVIFRIGQWTADSKQ